MAGPKKSKDGISKMEAVRQAIAKLGKEAKPPEILTFVKENFGVVMSYDMASNYKGTAIKQMGGKKRGRKPGPKPAVAACDWGGRLHGRELYIAPGSGWLRRPRNEEDVPATARCTAPLSKTKSQIPA